MKIETCSKCGMMYPKELCYRSNITGLILCANCIAEKRRENQTKLRYPITYKPSILRMRELNKKKKREKYILTNSKLLG